MNYAQVEKDGIVQSVTKEQFKTLIDGLSRADLLKLIFRLSDELGQVKGMLAATRYEPTRKGGYE